MCDYDGDGWPVAGSNSKINLATSWISYSTASSGRYYSQHAIICCGLTGAIENSVQVNSRLILCLPSDTKLIVEEEVGKFLGDRGIECSAQRPSWAPKR